MDFTHLQYKENFIWQIFNIFVEGFLLWTAVDGIRL